jgi:hypothetical protein
MGTRHTAYGLDIDASFELPGMRPAVPTGLPPLTLELLGPEQLQAAWHGTEEPPVWIGRLGDGCELTIEYGASGDVLFSYGDRARFRLDASHERLECAPLREGLHWQQTLLARVLPDIAIIRGYEALHASAVQSPLGVVALAAPSGIGKTTLALELVRRGWPLVTDDVLVLEATPSGVRAHPGIPHTNVGAGPAASFAPQLGVTLATFEQERWLAVETVATEPGAVCLICLLERGPELQLQARTLPANPLPLAPYMLGLPCDSERQRRRFATYAELMGGATLMRLSCKTDNRPAELADAIEHVLGIDSPLVVGGTG